VIQRNTNTALSAAIEMSREPGKKHVYHKIFINQLAMCSGEYFERYHTLRNFKMF
jgi:hypothetical protein